MIITLHSGDKECVCVCMRACVRACVPVKLIAQVDSIDLDLIFNIFCVASRVVFVLITYGMNRSRFECSRLDFASVPLVGAFEYGLPVQPVVLRLSHDVSVCTSVLLQEL